MCGRRACSPCGRPLRRDREGSRLSGRGERTSTVQCVHHRWGQRARYAKGGRQLTPRRPIPRLCPRPCHVHSCRDSMLIGQGIGLLAPLEGPNPPYFAPPLHLGVDLPYVWHLVVATHGAVQQRHRRLPPRTPRPPSVRRKPTMPFQHLRRDRPIEPSCDRQLRHPPIRRHPSPSVAEAEAYPGGGRQLVRWRHLGRGTPWVAGSRHGPPTAWSHPTASAAALLRTGGREQRGRRTRRRRTATPPLHQAGWDRPLDVSRPGCWLTRRRCTSFLAGGAHGPHGRPRLVSSPAPLPGL